MARRGQTAATYVTEHIGTKTHRPELNRLIAAAARKPRPFDILMVWRIDALGTPEDAHNAVARLAEHGIEVIATEPIPPLTPSDYFINWIRDNAPQGQNAQEQEESANAQNLIKAPDTRSILVKNMQAALAYESMQMDGPADTNGLTWPFDDTTYIEYSKPLKLDGSEPGNQELLHGMLMVPTNDPATRTVISLYTNGVSFAPFRHDISFQHGHEPSEIKDAAATLIALITAPGAELQRHAGTDATHGRDWLVLHPAPGQRYPEVTTGQ